MRGANNAKALFRRSRPYGEPSPAHEAERAALLIRSAELGYREAQRELGCRYATGQGGFPVDLTLARVWYGRAAEAGHADAQFNFGIMLFLGEGGPLESELGKTWVHRAAAQNDPCALRFLAAQAEAETAY